MSAFALVTTLLLAPPAAPIQLAAVTREPSVAAVSARGSTAGLGKSPSPKPRCEAPMMLSKKSRALQKSLERGLAEANLSKYVKKGRLSVALVDVTRPDEPYYAGVNDDEMMYAASLPKIAILLSVAQAASDGQVSWNPEFDQRLTAMITESSNSDATWGAEQVGLKSIEGVMRDPRYCLYDDVHGGLWVGRNYGPTKEENRDPMKDLSHAATARQAARFYAMLNARELVSKDWSDHMLALMGPPKHHHKFVAGLKNRDDVSFVARKSGSWRNYHADSALIQHGDERYVAVAISELKNGESVMQEVIRVLDDVVKEGKYKKKRPARS